MPLAQLQKQGGSILALWHIAETENELAFASMEAVPEEILSPQKRLEYLAARTLLKQVAEQAGAEYIGVHKDEHGKPYLKNLPQQISLSHSFPYVAVQWHDTRPVGIDIEQPKDKLLRVATRVLAPAELVDAGNDVVKHCVYWCAKEAMYKLYGKRGLHFHSQLLVAPFSLSVEGRLQGTILAGQTKQKAALGYRVTKNYVLAFILPEE
ncbi:MAG: 4'-phosphopantetheinyl transferase family protein [Bacteroidota bacterium]